MELLAIIIGLTVVGYHLGSRITRLEERVKKIEGGLIESVDLSPIPTPNTPFTPVPMQDGFQYIEEKQSSSAPHSSAFFDWIAKDFMVQLGAFLLLLAVGWFVSYAIAEEWIGPVGQITLGLLFGVAFLPLGVWRIETHRHQGGIFTVLGATIILLTLFAACGIYGFFTPISALFIMLMAIAFVGFVAVRYKSQRLAFSGLIMAYLAPFFTAAMPIPAIDLFFYLLVITGGILWTVWQTGWTKLILTSLIFIYLYSVTYLLNAPSVYQDTTLIFSFVFVTVYFVANMVSLVRRQGEGKKHMAIHTLTALGTAIFLFTWIESAVDQEWKSLLYTAWALVFALGTYVVYFYTANKSAFYLYGATSIALIGVATAAELEGPVLTLAYLLEIGLLILAAGRLGVSNQISARISWLLVIPVLLSLQSFSPWLWRDGIPPEHFVVLGATMVMLALIGWYLKVRDKGEGGVVESGLSAAVFMITSSIYAVSLIWLVLHALINDDLATMLALIIYTVVGITLFVSGARQDNNLLKIAGGALIGLSVARLLLVDVWDMELGGRIITFLIIGALLISTAFIRKQHSSENASSQ